MSNSHSISLSTAAEMTSRYRSNRNTVLKTEYQSVGVLATCETFSKAAIEELIDQTGCVGFRIYYGMDQDLKIHAILVGVNGNDADILPAGNSLSQDPPGEILEEGQRCPPYCPPTSPFNSD